MSMVDELAEARTYISDQRHQLAETHERFKAAANAAAVRADENQRLEYELRKAQGEAQRLAKLSGLYYDNQARAGARIAELEAERDSLLATESFDYDNYGKALLRIARLEGESEGRLRALNEIVNERNVEWARAEMAEAEAARYRRLLSEVLDYFTEKGHPGRPALRTGWAWVETVEGWRQALAAAAREPDGYDPLGTERWVDGEPSNDISQWDTNGTSID